MYTPVSVHTAVHSLMRLQSFTMKSTEYTEAVCAVHNVLGLSMVTHELSVMKGCIKDGDMNVRVSVTARRLAISCIVCLIFISWLSCCSGGLLVCWFVLSLVARTNILPLSHTVFLSSPHNQSSFKTGNSPVSRSKDHVRS